MADCVLRHGEAVAARSAQGLGKPIPFQLKHELVTGAMGKKFGWRLSLCGAERRVLLICRVQKSFKQTLQEHQEYQQTGLRMTQCRTPSCEHLDGYSPGDSLEE